MEMIRLGETGPLASRIGLGMMRMAELTDAKLDELLDTALELGVTLFDHADIYGRGRSEERFGEALRRRPELRGRMLVQSKCGIRDGLYDLSKEHILSAVDKSLQRLQCDRLDVLLLHRPDALMEPEEVAEAFDQLAASGKVSYFGVSNFGAGETELLRRAMRQPLIVNQLQFSAAHTPLLDASVNIDMLVPAAQERAGGALAYCRLNGITVQTWSPLKYGFFEGTFVGSEKYAALNKVLERIAGEQDASPEAVAIAWILRHPAKMQPIVGTTRPDRLRLLCDADRLTLSRDQWYEAYKAAGNKLP